MQQETYRVSCHVAKVADLVRFQTMVKNWTLVKCKEITPNDYEFYFRQENREICIQLYYIDFHPDELRHFMRAFYQNDYATLADIYSHALNMWIETKRELLRIH